MSEEKRYTLEEAKRELNKAECARFDHDYRILKAWAEDRPVKLYCDRCGKGWKVVDA